MSDVEEQVAEVNLQFVKMDAWIAQAIPRPHENVEIRDRLEVLRLAVVAAVRAPQP